MGNDSNIYNVMIFHLKTRCVDSVEEMEGQWFQSVLRNQCYSMTNVVALPQNDDILLWRGANSWVKVVGHRASTKDLICVEWRRGQGVWESGRSKTYARYDTNGDGSFRRMHHYDEKMIPKVPEVEANAIPVAVVQAPPQVVERVVYRERVVERVVERNTSNIPSHIKNEIVEFVRFGKEFECPICMETIAPDAFHITKCGHFYCNGCIGGVQPDYRGHRHCPSCREVL